MEKIILFYKFVPVADPTMCVRWQTELCKRLGRTGRVIISEQGINGTLGGPLDALLAYKRSMNETDQFRGIDYKWTAGSGADFPKLSVKARPELVAFGRPDLVEVDDNGVVNGGVHLKPRQLNELMTERGDDVVFFDGRNAYEAEIGKFNNAIVPDVNTTHDFIDALDNEALAQFKDRPIVTYCTGGIRCEVISAAMKDRGFNEVYQLDGGIVKYVEKYGEAGHWKGSVYTFDKRMVVDFGQETSTLGACDTCGDDEKIFVNCVEPPCKERFLRCETCCRSDQHCVAHREQTNHC